MGYLSRRRFLAGVSYLAVTACSAGASDHHGGTPPVANGDEKLDIKFHRVLMIGDSLTVASGDYTVAGLPGRAVEVAAMGGLPTSAALSFVQGRDITVVDLLIVAAGTNDAYHVGDGAKVPKMIDDMVVASDPTPVMWVNVDSGGAMPDASFINSYLASTAEAVQRFHVADWDRYITRFPWGQSWRAPDRIHYTDEGNRVRGSWIADEALRVERLTRLPPPTT